jgi:hypothetical protein
LGSYRWGDVSGCWSWAKYSPKFGIVKCIIAKRNVAFWLIVRALPRAAINGTLLTPIKWRRAPLAGFAAANRYAGLRARSEPDFPSIAISPLS